MIKKSRSSTALEPETAASPARTLVSQLKPQQGASPLLFAGKRLAQLRRDSVLVWDTATWTVTAQLPLEQPQALGRLSDGSLLVIDNPATQKGMARIQVLPPGGPLRTSKGSLTTSAVLAYALPGQSTDEFLLDSPGLRAQLVHYRFMPGGMVLGDDDYEMGPNDHKAVTALTGGRVACASSQGLSVIKVPGGAQHTKPADVALAIVHIAPGPDPEQVWVTNPPDHLRLLTLGPQSRIVKDIRPGHGMIFHMHAAGDAVAALSVVESADGASRRFTLSLHGADGKERWQTAVELPQSVPPAFVAVGENAVAVGGAEWVKVWGLSDGKPRALSPG